MNDNRYYGEDEDSDEELKMPSLVLRELREEHEEEEEAARIALKRVEVLASKMLRAEAESEAKRKKEERARMYRILDYMHEIGKTKEEEADEDSAAGEAIDESSPPRCSAPALPEIATESTPTGEPCEVAEENTKTHEREQGEHSETTEGEQGAEKV